ncbi:RDD family protein [Sorangium sp. So ce726]|uniref:RDD family protein n=1 Tax=Sorangium sp. So ce726 TaxID=3133319 RepID=UPI003F62BB0C
MIHRETLHEPLDTSAEIETPEHVRFRHQVAGPARRALAYLIDLVLRGVIVFAVGMLAAVGGIAVGPALRGASTGFVLLVLFAIEWGYYVFFETLWSGRTPGKHALSLRVVTDGGQPLRFGDSLLRNLLRAADLLPPFIDPFSFLGTYAVGLTVMGRDPRFRRLGDLVGGTLVIVEARHTVAGPLVLRPAPSPAELASLPARLPLSGEELDAIELFLRRLDRLSPARANELAEMVAPALARRMGVRYKDATRFLGVLHYRAHAHRGGQDGAASGPRPGRKKEVSA